MQFLDDETYEIEEKIMDDDSGRESPPENKKITLSMLRDEIQKINKTLEELKQNLGEIKNDISHILEHMEKNQ